MAALDFDFITDEQFRKSLTSDYREMMACSEADSWKAVHVLAGSIVEALLIEYLSISKIRPNGNDPLKIGLNDAILACEKAGVISKTTASLCDVIRDYRNLIHPGRVIRLQGTITPAGGIIAINLVTVITKEIAERRKENYGPTAEQIAKKLCIDLHSQALIPQLLVETNEHERIRLVSTVIPQRYAMEKDNFADDEMLNRLRSCYRQALYSLPPVEQAKVAERFARSVREDSSETIQAFGDVFFSSSDIAHLSPRDASLVVKHLTTRLDQSIKTASADFLTSLEGLGQFVPAKDLSKFADSLIRLALNTRSETHTQAFEFAKQEFDYLREDDQPALTKRLDVWKEFGKEKGYSEEAMQILETLSSHWLVIPF